jgi:hypothetical protein
MKTISLTGMLIFSALLLNAGKWDPYVSQGIVNPSILPGVTMNGAGLLTFTIGNNGTSPVMYVENQEMKVVICLSYGIPNITAQEGSSAMTVLGGTWSDLFSWSYDVNTNCYTGIQNRDIPALDQGTISIHYKVSIDSPEGMPSNGFNVNIVPPAYTNGINLTDNDAVSTYTFTASKNPTGLGEKEDKELLVMYSYMNEIFVKDLTGNDLHGILGLYNMIGQKVSTNKLYGGSVNKFRMFLEDGYYFIEVIRDRKIYHGKVYLTK